MSRTTTITLSALVAGFVVGLICCALAAWHLAGFDALVRVVMPLSGGIKNLEAFTSRGRFLSIACWLNAAIYGAIGFVVGVLLQIFRPRIERPLD